MSQFEPLEAVDPGWAAALRPVEPQINRIWQTLHQEAQAGATILPPPRDVFRAFRYPFEGVKVLIVGQDPYPTVGNSMGLAFSVRPEVRLPASLRNIYAELRDDLGCNPPSNGDLSGWAEQGVFLLNRVLTVREGESGCHAGLGWEEVTDQAIRALRDRGGPLVAILWGRQAQRMAPLLGGVPIIQSAHPSPLSARRGFFGSRPFSTTNALLLDEGATPVHWCEGA